MANEDDDLRLNTLNRFAKKSPRLALQEHSHCEVPAGCGGVVLRWVNPDEGAPGLLMVAFDGRTKGYLDGAELETGRLVLPYGEHVLAISLERTAATAPTSPVLFAAGLVHDDGQLGRRALPGAATGQGDWLAIPAGDGGSGWQSPDVDDASWLRLAAAAAGTVAALPPETPEGWRFRELDRAGLRALVLPDAPALWVRHRFTVVKP